jgi:polyhydroxyalkanoate synthesis regulator protein
MAMFSDAMKVFNPFAAAMGGTVPGAPAPGKPQGGPSAATGDDLQALKDQLAAMQQKIDTLANK